MKKFIYTLILALVSCLAVNAEGWQITHQKGDELRDVQPYTQYLYTSVENDCLFGFKGNFNKSFILTPLHGIFDYHVIGSTTCVNAVVGFYDGNRNLTNKCTILLAECGGGSNSFFAVGEEYANSTYKYIIHNKEDYVPKIINYLMTHNKSSYIRIIVPRYGRTDIDMIIPCMGK